jgi:peptidoglycan/LPS O-acetylase OafA/YrhL
MPIANLPLQPARRINVVEAARGVCALYVVVAHTFQILGYKYSLRADFPLMVDLLSGYPHQAVLCFFLLSGFSIHYASLGRPLDELSGVIRYVYLRLRRVYPIFLLVVLASFVFYYFGSLLGLDYYQRILTDFSWKDAVLTVFFLADRSTACGRIATVLPTNPPFWSLSYEILYYFIYPVFWKLSRDYSIYAAVAVGCLISFTSFVVGKFGCGHFSNVLSLYFVWCLGALLAEYKRLNANIPLPRIFFYLAPFFSVVIIWVIAQSKYANIDTLFWVMTFFVIMAIPVSTGSSMRLSVQESFFCLVAMSVLTFLVIVLARWKALSDDMHTFYLRLGLFSVLFAALILSDGYVLRNRFLQWLITRFYWLGSISYGMYLVHYSWLVWGRELTHKWSLPIDYALLVIPIILCLAWLLEIRYQPWVSGRLDRIFLLGSDVRR